MSWEDSEGRLTSGAIWYAEHGWHIIPCYGIVDNKCTCKSPHKEPKDVGKHPIIREWNSKATSDVSTIRSWWNDHPEANIGVYCKASGFFVIDIDPRTGGFDSFDRFEELVGGNLPPTVEAITGMYNINSKILRGRHLFYKCSSSESFVANMTRSSLKGIDIKHNGYVLVSPSRHFSGVSYEWAEGKAPWDIEIADAPEELLKSIRRKNKKDVTTVLGDSDWTSILSDLESDREKINIDEFLEKGIDEGSRAVDIYKLTCAIANKFPVNTQAGKIAVETMMIRFNAEKVRPPLELEGSNGLLMHVRNAINYVVNNPKEERLWPGISEHQKEWARGSKEKSKKSSEGEGIPKDPDSVDLEQGDDNPVLRSLSDTGNGRRIVDSFSTLIRYTSGLGWFGWSENYWKSDPENLSIQEIAKKLSPIIASEIRHYESDRHKEILLWAKSTKSNPRIKAAIESARSDPRIVVSIDQWDSKDDMLGVLNGVVDLKTGELLQENQDFFMTRRCPVAYNRGVRNKVWESFIDYATDGDKEFQEWLQKAVGYTLTGYKNYDVLFLVYGPSGSGKNTFVEAIVKCLGSQQYAWPLESTIIASDDGKSFNTDSYHWAMLRGRRMVWIDELPDSERIKENAIKKITGSSEISARSPGEKPVSFKSQAKMWISTNHRPIITDEAMWRRLRPIPFTNVPKVSDPSLKDYIFDPEGALPAVLSWAVEGAIKMTTSREHDPLGWCKQVLEASNMYKKNEDRISLFLEEETSYSPGHETPIKVMYGRYRSWSDERGDRPLSLSGFYRKMQEKGVTIKGTGSRASVSDYKVHLSGASSSPEWGGLRSFS